MMHSFRWLNCSIVWSVHHGIRFPSLSNCRPISSNPCVISCPITAPIPTSKARMALSLRRRIPFTYRHSSNIYNETKIDEDRWRSSLYFGASLLKKGRWRIPAGKAKQIDREEMDSRRTHWFDSVMARRTRWSPWVEAIPKLCDLLVYGEGPNSPWS